jgi:type I restriction enzyme S subunit
VSTVPTQEKWKTIPLRYVCQLYPSVDFSKFEDDDELTFLPMDKVKSGYFVPNTDKFSKYTPSYNAFENGDIVLAKVTPCFENGNIAIAEKLESDKGFGSSELFVIRPSAVNRKFLFYYFQSSAFKQEGEASMTGAGGLKRVSPDLLRQHHLPFPEEKTQRLIADYLDRETARIDALVTEKEKMLALLEEKRAELIGRAVTRGLDPDAPLKPSGLDWLGDIPAHWDVIQVRFACPSLQTGPFGSQLHAEEYIDNGTPVINPAHLKDNKITPDYGISVDDETADRLSVHKLKEGDVVFGRRGELGRCGVVGMSQEGWLCGTGSLRVRCDQNKIDPKYLALVFNGTNAAKRLTVESVGSTMDNLNTEMLGHFRIPYPPINEQKAIVSQIETTHVNTHKLTEQLLMSVDLAKERRAALITAAVTGQIPVEEMSA